MMDELLNELKDCLQITWSDTTTERMLMKLLTRGQTYLNEICKTEFTFLEGSTERELLIERCRYAWNNALDEFDVNYKKELQRLIMSVAVEKYKASVLLNAQ